MAVMRRAGRTGWGKGEENGIESGLEEGGPKSEVLVRRFFILLFDGQRNIDSHAS